MTRVNSSAVDFATAPYATTTSQTWVDVPGTDIRNLQIGKQYLLMVNASWAKPLGDWTGAGGLRIVDNNDNEVGPVLERGNCYNFFMHNSFPDVYASWMAFYVYTPTGDNIEVRGQMRTLNGATMGVRNFNITVIGVEGYSFNFDENTTPQTTDGGAATPAITANTITDTFAAEEHLVIGFLQWDTITVINQSQSYSATIELNGSEIDSSFERMDAGDTSISQCCWWVGNFLAGSNTVDLLADIEGNAGLSQAASLDLNQSQLLVIPLSEFDSFSYQWTESDLTITDPVTGTYPTYTANYLNNMNTVTHPQNDGVLRRHLVMAKARHGGQTSRILHPRLSIDSTPVGFQQYDPGGNAGLRVSWNNSDSMNMSQHCIHEADAAFTADWDACTGPFGATWQRSEVTQRGILVVDLGPADNEDDYCIRTPGAGNYGITGTDNKLGSPWSADPIRTIEAHVFRGQDGLFTFCEFSALTFTLFMLQCTPLGDLSMTATTSQNLQFTVDVPGSMPTLNRWYHVVVRYSSPGVYLVYVGDTGIGSLGQTQGAAASFPSGYSVATSGQLADTATGLYGLGVAPGTAINTTYQIGGPSGQAEDMEGGFSELRVWAGDVLDTFIDTNKAQFIEYDPETSPLDRLFVCARLNTATPTPGYVGSGWRQWFPDNYWGGGLQGHPWAGGGGGPTIQFLNATSSGVGAVSASLPAILSASDAGTSSMAANLIRNRALSAQSDGVGSLANPTMASMTRILEASDAGTSTFTPPVLDVDIFMSATINGVGDVAAHDLLVLRELVATAAGTSDIPTQDLRQGPVLSCTAAGTGAITPPAFANPRELNATATGTSSVTTANLVRDSEMSASSGGAGSFSVPDLVPLRALSASDSGSGSLSATFNIALRASIAGVGSVTPSLIAEHPLAASDAGSGSLSAHLTAQLAATAAGSGSASADLGSPARVLSATAAGSGSVSSAAAIAEHPLNATAAGTGDLTTALNVDPLLSASFTGFGSTLGILSVVPIGGVGDIYDSAQIDMYQNERTIATSAQMRQLHGGFTIQQGMVVNDRIRIAFVPAGEVITSLSVDYDAIGLGGTLNMQVGTLNNLSAFIPNVDVTVQGVATMTSGGPEARGEAGIREIYLSFSGASSFIVGAKIRLVGVTVKMPDPEEVTT